MHWFYNLRFIPYLGQLLVQLAALLSWHYCNSVLAAVCAWRWQIKWWWCDDDEAINQGIAAYSTNQRECIGNAIFHLQT